MGLDFYIAKSKDSINFEERGVSLSGDLQEYLYRNRMMIDIDIRYINDLDPYGDTEIKSDDINLLMEICYRLINSDYLSDYESEEDEENEENGRETLEELRKLCIKARESGENIYAIGD